MMKETLLALIAAVVICMLLSAPVLAAKGGNGKSNCGNQPDWGYSDKPGCGWAAPPVITITIRPVGQLDLVFLSTVSLEIHFPW